MPIYFAPLEGITDAYFRRIHHQHFSGVSKYYIPFISPTQNLCFTHRDLTAISPELNAGVPAVPQILTKHAAHFLWAAQQFADMGYKEVNLNAGCPSGTVTAKGKGAGMLTDIPALESFLDVVFAKSPLPVSIKTRIGFTSAAEFERILELYERYPICELTIHPRTRTEYYKGAPHRDIYAEALQSSKLPLVYNGDLFSADACRAFEASYPGTKALMLGRGLIANPALAQELSGGSALDASHLRRFHDDLMEAYCEVYPPHVVLGRIRELALHIVCCFDNPAKPQKAIRKASTLQAYREAIDKLFSEHALCAHPAFSAR